MFEYSNGYEIDGSDTSFDVMMPDRVKLLEVVEYFLCLPLLEEFDLEFEKDVWAPHRDGIIRNPQKPELILQRIAERENEPFYIIAACLHPTELPPDLKQEIYSLSASRLETHQLIHPETNPEEDKDFQAELYLGADSRNPSVGLDSQYDSLAIALVVDYQKVDAPTAEPQMGEDGYVINAPAYVSSARQPNSMSIEITCGPSFIYEYAMYVINHLTARFPEFSVTGGLDCSGGFLYGCTYAMSLYTYEVLEIEAGPDINTVVNIMRTLNKKGILYPCFHSKDMGRRNSFRYYTSKQWKSTRVNSVWGKPENLTIPEYITYLETTAAAETTLRQQKADNALMFCIRKPVNQSEPVEWDDLAQFTAYCDNHTWKIELHVPSRDRGRVEKALINLNPDII